MSQQQPGQDPRRHPEDDPDVVEHAFDATGGPEARDLPGAGGGTGAAQDSAAGAVEGVLPGGQAVSDLEEPADVDEARAALAASRTAERAADAADAIVAAPGEVLLDVQDVKVHFPIKSGVLIDRTVGYVYAVDGVSLQVRRGETYGLVGESGCGKTTLGRGILRLTEPTAGKVIFDGTDIAALSRGALRRARRRMQMVFQDPLSSLDPRQSLQAILVEGMRAHGLDISNAATNKRLRELLSAVGLPARSLKKFPHEFSGGQRQRIGVARALTVNPDLIVADEPVSALDVSVQAQVINLLEDLQAELGLTYIVIAHDLAVVKHISDRVGVMYLGSMVEEADAAELYARPLHPYTKALMSAVPVPDPRVEDTRERILLTGDLPSPANPPSGCRFHTRCPWRQPTRCDTERPELVENSAGHRVACHWVAEIESGQLQPHDIADAVV
jgi:peptide/nickel transport system ATP-binding protein